MEGLGQFGSFLPIILMFAVIYFLMIRPQQKKMKLEKQYESNLKVGDKVVTKSGIYGRIGELNETTIILETMAGKIQMERSAISMEMSQKRNNESK